MSLTVICELEGVVANVRPAWWWAYELVTSEMGLPKTEPDQFWLAVRRGQDWGTVLVGSKAHHVERFEDAFQQKLASPEAIRQMPVHDGVADALAQLHAARFAIHFVTAAPDDNGVRDRWLADQKIKTAGPVIHASGPSALAAAQLQPVIGEPRFCIALASTERTLRAMAAADLKPVGITSGPCIGDRLFRAGAQVSRRNLSALLKDWQAGSAELRPVRLPDWPRTGRPKQESPPSVEPSQPRERLDPYTRRMRNRRR